MLVGAIVIHDSSFIKIINVVARLPEAHSVGCDAGRTTFALLLLELYPPVDEVWFTDGYLITLKIEMDFNYFSGLSD